MLRIPQADRPTCGAPPAWTREGFLAAHPPPVILDEVQHAPDLLAFVKEAIDE